MSSTPSQVRPSRAAPPAADSFVCKHCGSTRCVIRYTFSGVDKVIRECSVCRLMVLHPMPTEQDLKATVYNEGYFENDKLTEGDVSRVYGYVDYISERINKQKGYREICATLKRFVVPEHEPPKLLDYGCGLGFFLDVAYEFGFDVRGIEFNDYAIEYMRRRYAYPVSSVANLPAAEKFDVIAMLDVIEHLREPFRTLEQVRGMLTDHGVVAIATMDSTSLTSRLMGKRLEDFRRVSEHLYFFSRGNLASILQRHGFDVLHVASKGHSFEVKLLAARLRSVLPAVGVPLSWLLRVVPFVGSWSIYLDPRTKFIVYARKRRTAADPVRRGLLSIVVPVYNEAATIETVLDKLMRVDYGVHREIIVVDDGSTDGTSEVLAEYEARGAIAVIRKPNEGKGSAVAAGIRATRGDYVVIQDADTEYDPADIPALLATMTETGALAVYGSRYAGRFRKTGLFFNTIANTALTFINNVVNNLNLSDVMTGYKLFDGHAIRAMTLRSKGFEFEAEVTCKLRRAGIGIYEAPISYNARTYLEGKKIRTRDGWRTLSALVRFGVLGRD